MGLTLLFEAERLRMNGRPAQLVRKAAGRAKRRLSEALKLVGRDGDPRRMANLHGNLGLALSMVRQFKLAEHHLLEALRLFRSLHVPSEEAACLANMGYYYKEYAVGASGISKRTRLERLNSALSYASAAHALKVRAGTPRRIALSAHDIGEIHGLLGHRSEAVRWLQIALESFRALGLERYAADVQRAMDQLG